MDDTEHMDAEHNVVQQGTHTNLGLSDNELSETRATERKGGTDIVDQIVEANTT